MEQKFDRSAEDLGNSVGLEHLNLTVPDPSDPTDPVDVDAARRIDGLHNRFFLDPIFRGAYPADVLEDTADLTWQGNPWYDVVHDGDLATIATPIDVLGVNYYHGNEVSGHPRTDVVGIGADHPDRVSLSPFVGSEHVTFPSRGLPVTDMGWEIQPDGLYRLLRRLHDDYPHLPIHLTVLRNNHELVNETTSTSRMKRRIEDLVAYLFRELDFPEGVLLMTGTGIVPDDDFSLASGDLIRIRLGSLLLENRVS